MTATADQLSSLKTWATVAVSTMLREEKEWLARGITEGYLADSAMDGLLVDADEVEIYPLSFTSACGEYQVIVRTESDHVVQDYLVTPIWPARPSECSYQPSGFSIREDMRVYKEAA